MISSWDDSLETGNQMIDGQHRQLISLLDELQGELKTYSRVLELLDQIMDFTNTHFLMEEELMRDVRYPVDATKTMVSQHKDFKAYVRLRVLEFRQDDKFSGALCRDSWKTS